MKAWKLVGGLGVGAGICAVIAVAAPALGDSQAADSTDADDLGRPYELGPHAIPYENQPSSEQDNIDRMGAKTQGGDSSEALARAAEQEARRAQIELAKRQVGLNGTDEQGVVP